MPAQVKPSVVTNEVLHKLAPAWTKTISWNSARTARFTVVKSMQPDRSGVPVWKLRNYVKPRQ
jgi:hypothetical protein